MVLLRFPKISLGLLGAALIGMVGSARADEMSTGGLRQPPSPPEISVRWVDDSGKLHPLPTALRKEWVWIKRKKKSPSESPAIQVSVPAPDGYSFDEVTDSGNMTVERLQPEKAIKVTTDSANALAKIKITTNEGVKVVANVVVTVASEQPYIWVDPSCSEMGVDLVQISGSTNYLHAGAICRNENGVAYAQVFHPSDFELKGQEVEESKKRGSGWVEVALANLKPPASEPVTLVKFALKSSEGAASTDFEIQIPGLRRPSRLSWGLGAGLTYLNYHETTNDFRLNQIGITPTVSATYALFPNLVELSGNAFATMISPYHSPSTHESSRFLGLNGRIGYRIPKRTGTVMVTGTGAGTGPGPWTVSVGWYLWSMFTPDSTYGVSSLSEPQVLISYRGDLAKDRALYVYIKYAPILGGSDLFLSNREFALGATLTLPYRKWGRVWSATLDLADLSFASNQDQNSMRIVSSTLGVQVSL